MRNGSQLLTFSFKINHSLVATERSCVARKNKGIAKAERSCRRTKRSVRGRRFAEHPGAQPREAYAHALARRGQKAHRCECAQGCVRVAAAASTHEVRGHGARRVVGALTFVLTAARAGSRRRRAAAPGATSQRRWPVHATVRREREEGPEHGEDERGDDRRLGACEGHGAM